MGPSHRSRCTELQEIQNVYDEYRDKQHYHCQSAINRAYHCQSAINRAYHCESAIKYTVHRTIECSARQIVECSINEIVDDLSLLVHIVCVCCDRTYLRVLLISSSRGIWIS